MATKRKKGTGMVRHRKDGRWEGRVTIGYKPDGTPQTKNVLAKTKAECVAKLKEMQGQAEKPVEEPKSNMTFGEWLDLWYQMDSRPGLRDATRENYENWIYNHLIPRLGTVKIDELSQSDLQNFFITMKRGGRLRLRETKGKEYSNRSVRSCWSVCKMALDRAKEERLININPAEGCRLPARNDGEMQSLTQEEMKRFLIEADAEGFYELFLLELSTAYDEENCWRSNGVI